MVNVAFLFLVVQFECFNLKTSIDVIVCMLSGSKTEIEGHNYIRTLVVELYQVLKSYKTAVLVHACWCVNTSKILANHVPECEFVMISWTLMTSWLLTSQILETAGNCSLKHKKNTFPEQATKSKLLRFILCDQMYKYRRQLPGDSIWVKPTLSQPPLPWVILLNEKKQLQSWMVTKVSKY